MHQWRAVGGARCLSQSSSAGFFSEVAGANRLVCVECGSLWKSSNPRPEPRNVALAKLCATSPLSMSWLADRPAQHAQRQPTILPVSTVEICLPDPESLI